MNANDVVSVSISPITPNRLWALERSSGLVRTSGDGGQTWSSAMSLPFSGVGGTMVLADPRDSNAAFCTFLRSSTGAPRIMRTANGGQTWQNVSGDMDQGSVHTLALSAQAPTVWYAGRDLGVWRTVDSGMHWTRYASGLPNVLVLDLQFRRGSSELRAATYGRGLWSINAAAITSVETHEPAQGPYLRVLSRMPGPAGMQFGYAGRKGAAVVLSVIDVNGREVSRPVEEQSDGATHIVQWRARDLPSGIYFVVVRSDGKQSSRKIALLR